MAGALVGIDSILQVETSPAASDYNEMRRLCFWLAEEMLQERIGGQFSWSKNQNE